MGATGFVPTPETQHSYLALSSYILQASRYRDQHSTLQRNDSHWSLEEQRAGRQLPTQVGRALEQLGIEIMVARSPQAKGRIERMWRTFQDRLGSELRAEQAVTLEQANAVLARFVLEYNRQFGKPAAERGCAYRKLDRRLDLDQIFSLQYECKVGQDHVIRVGPGVVVQLPPLPGKRGFAGRKVLVCHLPDGRLRVYLEGRLLVEQAADPWAGPVRALDMRRRSAPPRNKPPRLYTYAGRPANRF